MDRWLALAMKIARESDHPHHHLGCVIIKGGAVLAKSCNLARWGRCAERRALRPHVDLKDATAYVVRTNGGNSRPCKYCQQALRVAGVAFVVFVNERRQVCKEAVA